MDKMNVNDDMEIDPSLHNNRPIIKQVVYRYPGPTTSTYFYYKRNDTDNIQEGECTKIKYKLIGYEESNPNILKNRAKKRPYPWLYYKVYEPPSKMKRYCFTYQYMKLGSR